MTIDFREKRTRDRLNFLMAALNKSNLCLKKGYGCGFKFNGNLYVVEVPDNSTRAIIYSDIANFDLTPKILRAILHINYMENLDNVHTTANMVFAVNGDGIITASKQLSVEQSAVEFCEDLNRFIGAVEQCRDILSDQDHAFWHRPSDKRSWTLSPSAL